MTIPVTNITKKMPNVLICTPCYGSQLHQTYMISIIQLMNEVYKRKTVNIGFSIRGGDSLITRLRNSMTAEFLSNDAFTHLLWIDADIGFSPDEVFRLVESDHDIACGMYPLKSLNLPNEIPSYGQETINKETLFAKNTKYPFNPLGNTFEVKKDFVEVRDAPTGLMCIKREVFDKMVESYPDLKYSPDRQPGLEQLEEKINDFYYNFFDTMLSEDVFTDNTGKQFTKKRYLSEDYSFCRLWQNIGGRVHAYYKSKLTHTGLWTYQGDFEQYFKLNFDVRSLEAEQPQVEAIIPMAVPNLSETVKLDPSLGLKIPDLAGFNIMGGAQ